LNKKSKLIVITIVCISMFLIFVVPIAVEAEPKPPLIQLNGLPFMSPSGEPAPYINKDGRTMVPVRFLSSALGVMNDDQHIKWDAQNKMVTIVKDKTNIDIQVGNKLLMRSSGSIKMNTSAEMKSGRVFIPLRYIAESLDARIEWDEQKHIVHILTDTTNNFSRYNLFNISGGFPVSIKGNDSELTINSAFIYPYDSIEAKDIIQKYGFKGATEGTSNYLVWMDILLKSNEGKLSASLDGKNFPFSFGFNPADKDNVQPIQPKAEFDIVNNPDILYKWRLDQINVVHSHIALILTYKDIERFFVKSDKDQITLAIRQS
jgi:hypothetical protein